jgi:hypothetical protein
MERKNGLEQSMPDIHVLIIEIILEIVHVLTFKNFALCPQFPTILRTNKDYFLKEDQSLVLCRGDRVFVCGRN